MIPVTWTRGAPDRHVRTRQPPHKADMYSVAWANSASSKESSLGLHQIEVKSRPHVEIRCLRSISDPENIC